MVLFSHVIEWLCLGIPSLTDWKATLILFMLFWWDKRDFFPTKEEVYEEGFKFIKENM